VGIEDDTRRVLTEEKRRRLKDEYERRHGRLEDDASTD